MTKPVGCHHCAANWVISRKVQQSSGKSVRNCFALGWRRKCLDGVYHDYTDCEFLVVKSLRKFSIHVILIWSLNETDLRIPSAFATPRVRKLFLIFRFQTRTYFCRSVLEALACILSSSRDSSLCVSHCIRTRKVSRYKLFSRTNFPKKCLVFSEKSWEFQSGWPLLDSVQNVS